MTFARYRQLLAGRSFGWFWGGFTLSVLGDGLSRVALTWYVYETTGSAQALGWLMFWYTGPVIAGGRLAGWLLDRYDRRLVMVVDNAIRAAAMACIPLLYASGHLALWHIYAVAAVYGLLMMISLAGSPAMIPALVRREELATANALATLSFTLGGVVGPPLAGLLIAWLGAPHVVALDALSYACFALALFFLRPSQAGSSEPAAPGPSYHTGHVVRLLFTEPVLAATTFMFMAFNVGGGLLAVWLPVWADRVLGGGAGLYGGLLAALAAGEVASALLVGSRSFRRPLGTLICLAQLLSGVALGFVLTARTPWVTALGLALLGAFSAPLTIWALTLRMQIIPERLRGRAFALLRTLMQSGSPIGGALGGLLLPALGIPAMIVLSSLLVGLPGLLGARVKALRIAGGQGDGADEMEPVVSQLPASEGAAT
ncbi:MAG TPA: MFS transporter [Ardenticatenaceae bacterium]|nr:MFS transporter [Ardenticatenaceae bacterium]